MAYKISLLNQPNQELSFSFDDKQRYVVKLNALSTDDSGYGIMAATIDLNETRIISGVTVFPESLVIPYPYLEGDGGNLIFTSIDDNNIWYSLFNSSQNLYYLTADEVSEFRS